MASERLLERRRRPIHVVLHHEHAPRRRVVDVHADVCQRRCAAVCGVLAALRDVHDICNERRVTVLAPPCKFAWRVTTAACAVALVTKSTEAQTVTARSM